MVLFWVISGSDSSGSYTRESGSTLTKKTYTKPSTTSTSTSKTSITSSLRTSSDKSLIPRIITDNTSITTIQTSSGTKTWKGSPTDTVGIAEWKASFEPGYVPKIISPRDSSGNYTSDPSKTVGYITMDKETHAKEIAIALQSEPNIPTSIVDYLQKTLKNVKSSITPNAPTNIALTNSKKEEGKPRNLTDMTIEKIIAVVIALFILIFGILKLYETK